jgi:hypothetical protein
MYALIIVIAVLSPAGGAVTPVGVTSQVLGKFKRSMQDDCESAGRWWGHLRSKSFKRDLLVLRIHGREVIWLNPTARVGCKDDRLCPSGHQHGADARALILANLFATLLLWLDPVAVLFHTARAAGMTLIRRDACPRSAQALERANGLCLGSRVALDTGQFGEHSRRDLCGRWFATHRLAYRSRAGGATGVWCASHSAWRSVAYIGFPPTNLRRAEATMSRV